MAPKPAPATPSPTLVDCLYRLCFGSLPADGSDLTIKIGQRVVIDASSAIKVNNHIKLGTVVAEGSLVITSDAIKAGETLIIEIENFVLNTGEGSGLKITINVPRPD